MTNLQYHLIVQNGEITQEEGVFFKATPFQIISGDTVVDVVFTRNDQHHVVYHLTENGKTIADLEHPDYLPDCSKDALSSALPTSAADPTFIAIALNQVEVAKSKAFNALIGKEVPAVSYEIKQPFFFKEG